MRKFVSLALIIFPLFCSSCNEETIPQKKTWTTATSEKAYEIFPKYGEEAKAIFADLEIDYVITHQEVVEDEHDYIWFENEFQLDNHYKMSYYFSYDGQSPKSSFYYMILNYEVKTIEEILLSDVYFEMMYEINKFSTGGLERFNGVDFYKQEFNKAYQEIKKDKKNAWVEYNISPIIQWINFEIDIDYLEEREVYNIELKFADILSDDNVEN